MLEETLTQKEMDTVQFVIGKTKHYPFGKYVIEVEGNPTESGNIYEFHDIVSTQLNQLKAKLFNLIESTSTNEKQQEALKGLVKGFSNTTYRQILTDLCGLFNRLGFQVDDFGYNTDTLKTPYLEA